MITATRQRPLEETLDLTLDTPNQASSTKDAYTSLAAAAASAPLRNKDGSCTDILQNPSHPSYQLSSSSDLLIHPFGPFPLAAEALRSWILAIGPHPSQAHSRTLLGAFSALGEAGDADTLFRLRRSFLRFCDEMEIEAARGLLEAEGKDAHLSGAFKAAEGGSERRDGVAPAGSPWRAVLCHIDSEISAIRLL